MRIRAAVVFTVVATLAACSEPSDAPSNSPEPTPSEAAHANADTDTRDEPIVAGQDSKQLPASLLAELRLQGADANGRLLTLAPGFIATAACSDCGAPSYLWFLAVRCADADHCEVLTEVCEGKIARDGDTFVLEFNAVDGGPPENADVCAGYTGTFERP